MTGIDPLRAQGLGVPNGFFGRRGGVSTGPVASLNCGLGSDDDPAAIAENRRRAADCVLPGAALAGVYQVHGAEVVEAGDWPDEARPRADGLVTDRSSVLLAIVTADCAPVLFADRGAGVIGAAHAGWRGAVAGVTDKVIEAMERLGARRSAIHAAIGPCIARDSYEVDADFHRRLLALDPANAAWFTAAPGGRPHFDLPGYVAGRLRRAGITAVERLDEDTYAQPDLYYSFRRATHSGEADYGRQISLVGLG